MIVVIVAVVLIVCFLVKRADTQTSVNYKRLLLVAVRVTVIVVVAVLAAVKSN